MVRTLSLRKFIFLFQHPVYALCPLVICPTCGCLHIHLSYTELLTTFHSFISVHARMRGRVRSPGSRGRESNCRSFARPCVSLAGPGTIVYTSHRMVIASTYASILSVHQVDGYGTLIYTPMAHDVPTSMHSQVHGSSRPKINSCQFPSFTQIIYS